MAAWQATVYTILDGQKSDRDYIIKATAGQTLDVVLTTSSASVYFNVLPSGSPTALVNTSVTGQSSWTGTLPTDLQQDMALALGCGASCLKLLDKGRMFWRCQALLE
jgi:hypothetical protein